MQRHATQGNAALRTVTLCYAHGAGTMLAVSVFLKKHLPAFFGAEVGVCLTIGVKVPPPSGVLVFVGEHRTPHWRTFWHWSWNWKSPVRKFGVP